MIFQMHYFCEAFKCVYSLSGLAVCEPAHLFSANSYAKEDERQQSVISNVTVLEDKESRISVCRYLKAHNYTTWLTICHVSLVCVIDHLYLRIIIKIYQLLRLFAAGVFP